MVTDRTFYLEAAKQLDTSKPDWKRMIRVYYQNYKRVLDEENPIKKNAASTASR